MRDEVVVVGVEVIVGTCKSAVKAVPRMWSLGDDSSLLVLFVFAFVFVFALVVLLAFFKAKMTKSINKDKAISKRHWSVPLVALWGGAWCKTAWTKAAKC